MEGERGTFGAEEKYKQRFGGEKWRKETTSKTYTNIIILKRIFKNTAEMVDYIHLAQDRDKWRTVMNTVMNVRVRCITPLKS